MHWSKYVAHILIDHCKEYFSQIVLENHSFTDKKLGNRTYRVYDIRQFKEQLIDSLYEVLIESKETKGLSITIEKRHKSLVILTNTLKPLWYRVGLVLSDGAILDEYRLLFSSSSPYTITAILQGFNKILIYPAYYMVNMSNNTSICSYNFVVRDPDTVQIICRIKGDREYVRDFAKYLLNNNEHLVQFLAGIIDGDGAIDKDNVRVCISSSDPIFYILNEVFKDNISYDKKKYMLRISTSELRKRKLLSSILDHLVIPHKRKRLYQIIKKRKRVDIRLDKSCYNKIGVLVKFLSKEDITIISLFKYRRHGKYKYAYISVNNSNKDLIYKQAINVFLKISEIINVNLTEAVKMGKREIIVYSQGVVDLIEELQKYIDGDGRR